MNRHPNPQSLVSLQSEYLLQQIKRVCDPAGLYSLVLDKSTSAVVFSVLSKDALLRVVTTVEIIDDKRRMSNYLSALYLVEPSIFNFNCIVADVHAKRYKSGVGLFLPFSQWDEQEIRMFDSSKFLQNPSVSQYFGGGEDIHFVHASLVPVESRVFLTDKTTPNSMPIYYNENCADLVLPRIRKSAKAIVNSIIIAGEYPIIRFYSSPEASHQAARLPELIADEVQRQIDDYARAHQDYPPPSVNDKPRAIVLICDRTVDLYSPLLHEFTYQAMAMDIVEGLEREGVYKYKSENEKGMEQEMSTKLDDEADETWVSLRHYHIIEASELIVNKIGELIKNNPMMVDRSKAKTSSDLMYVVAHLQGFDDERRQVTLHKTLIDECLDINANRKLAEFAADFEQTCAAGGTSFEGIHNKHLHDDLIVLLARDDLHINDKVRLVLIYSLYRGGLAASDFKKLARFIGVGDNQVESLVSRCFNNMSKLNFPCVKASVKDKKIVRSTFHLINNEGTYNTSRFSPALKRLLHNAAKYELDTEWFPYFRDKPIEEDLPAKSGSGLEHTGSLRNQRIKASWAPSGSRQGSITHKARQRIFCFVAGGITLSEMRSVYELSSTLNKDFYIGSESILKPRDFLIGLQSIDAVKNPVNLDLPFYKEVNSANGPAPDYLFQLPPAPPTSTQQGTPSRPPGAPRQMSSLRQSESPRKAPQPMDANSRFNPQLPKSEASSSTPQHYQKRVNQFATDLTPEKPVKEKKQSRLKKLFK